MGGRALEKIVRNDGRLDMKGVARLGKAIVFVLAGSLLVWRIFSTNLAELFVQQAEVAGSDGTIRGPDRQPEWLYQQALFQMERDPPEAERLLRAAAWANPTDARFYLALAELWATDRRLPLAVGLVEFADALGPLRSPVLIGSADFWQRQNRLDRMLARWNTLLQTRSEFADRLYPNMLAFAEDPERRDLLRPLLAESPQWWESFFAYAARAAKQTDTVVFLRQNRPSGDEPPSQKEQSAYLDRLWRDARWQEAYRVWREGLTERQAKELGHLFNGGFELPLGGTGFDWRISPVRGVRVETAPTYGMRGDKALHLTFDGQRARFQHVLQHLVLAPGRYRLQGWVRPDSLQAERGLRWRVGCAPDGPLLAESERFLGLDEWRMFVVDWVVPETACPAQILRLELEGRAELDFEAKGGIWFDDLAISVAK